jgi:hypothetical protein
MEIGDFRLADGVDKPMSVDVVATLAQLVGL